MGAYVNGQYIPILGETGWDDEIDDGLRRSGEREVNVKLAPYGAKGDGVTDDWGPITAAVAAADAIGATVYFPPGFYKVFQPIDLSNVFNMHFLGGHSGNVGQFANPPIAGIFNVTTNGGAVSIVGNAESGNYTFENIKFFGLDQGFHGVDFARVRFINCKFEASTVGATDGCGLYLERCFWWQFRDCSFQAASSQSTDYSMILRGSIGTNAEGYGLGSMRWCVLVGGGILAETQKSPSSDAGNVQLYEVLSESSVQPLISFKEKTYTGAPAYQLLAIRLDYCGVADAGAGSVPLVLLDSPHAVMNGCVIVGGDCPGGNPVEVVNGLLRTLEVNSPRRLGLPRNGSDVLTGAAVRTKDVGYDILGTSVVPSATALNDTQGPFYRMGLSGDAYSRFGMDTDGLLTWGPGGATSTGYDTNLYRSAADTLKTDDALVVSRALFTKFVTLTDAATVAVNASLGTIYYLSTGSSRTIGAPSNAVIGQVIHFTISNSSGGAITTTWNANFHLAGAWTDPAAGKVRTITFLCLGATTFFECGRAAADITP